MKLANVVAWLASLAILIAGCGGSQSGAHVSKRTIVEHTPNGGTRTVTVTTRTVDAPAPPARPADPMPNDPLVRYNVERLNHYRARAGVGALLFDAKISAFAN